MKLVKLRIENFRKLGSAAKPFELDFTDALGRVRDFTLLVGPNGCGKTTILDASCGGDRSQPGNADPPAGFQT